MKVWEGYLALEYDYNKGDFSTRFGFGQLDGNFTLEENRMRQYWVSDEDDTCPVEMTIDTSFGDTYISKGFDRELSKKEQELLEIEMKVYLKECLRKENEKINSIYENKIKAINMKE
ncbi:TPA: hypothetical protein ACH354_002318 [Clostridium perfringens]|uniref:hypothetical protein n=1 Tax=Clostridium perfringens TaxID=1502 RepID=UPI001ABACE8B|nr:hypothetical protein [Clostridium perfringens]MBO3398390.1 hypothetical protein [Clostridium perfringens]